MKFQKIKDELMFRLYANLCSICLFNYQRYDKKTARSMKKQKYWLDRGKDFLEKLKSIEIGA